MKTTLLSILCCLAPAMTPVLPAQEHKPDAPREEKKGDGEALIRRELEMTRFQAEMEQHMKEAMEKAAQLEAEGKRDEAEEVRRHAKSKMQAAVDEHQRAMQGKMRDREQRERAAQAERGERERPGQPDRPRADRTSNERNEGERPGDDRRPAGADRPDGPPRSELERKLHHVEQAIGHLREAGLPDPADNLERLADRLRHALHNQEGPRPDGPRRDDDLAALRREVEALKQAVRQLCEKRDQEHAQDQPDNQENHH